MTKQQLHSILECGFMQGIKREDGEYCIFSPSKDCAGDYRYSGWCRSIEEAKEKIGDYNGQDEEDLEENIKEQKWELYGKPFLPERKIIPVGTKVRILNSIKGTHNWEDLKHCYPNMVGIIKEHDNNYSGYSYEVYKEDGSNFFYIGAEYLAPLIEEDTKKKEVEKKIKELKAKVEELEEELKK